MRVANGACSVLRLPVRQLQALLLVPGSHRLGKLPMEFGNWQSGDWVQPMDEITRKYGVAVASEPMQVGDVL